MASNESKINLNLKKNENLSKDLEISKNSKLNLLANKKILLGLFVTASISVFILVGLSVFIHLKKSELEVKANKNSLITGQEVAGINTNATSQLNEIRKLQPEEENPSKKNHSIKTNSEITPIKDPELSQIKEQILINQELKTTKETPAISPSIKFRNLSPQDFNDILLNISFENTLEPKIETTITGDLTADRHIYDIAESRGYRFWPQADESKLVEVQPGIRLQEKTKLAFTQMSDNAKKEGVILKITSGYRSQVEQNKIFRPRFEALEMAELGGYYDPVDLAKGEADNLIFRALALTAPAGYSRHHTGYAIDLADLSPDNTTSVFNGSKAFIWLSKDNYANARKFGFIPSYPLGLQNVGPEPESWEYVWVGEKAI